MNCIIKSFNPLSLFVGVGDCGYMSFENFSHYTEVRAHGLDSRKGIRSQV